MRLSFIALVLVVMLEEGVLALSTSTPSANNADRAPNAHRVDRNARLGTTMEAASHSRVAPTAPARISERYDSKASLIDADHQLDRYLNAAPRRTIAERPERAEVGSVHGKAVEVQHAVGQSTQRYLSDEKNRSATPHRMPRLAGLLSDARQPLRAGASGPATEQEKGTKGTTASFLTPSEKEKGKRKLAEYAGQDAEKPSAKKVRAPSFTSRLLLADKAGTSSDIHQIQERQADKQQPKPSSISTIRPADRPSGMSQSSRGVQRLDKRPTGRKGVQWDNWKTFDRVWKEQGLSTEMKPEILAEKVMQMRLHGVSSSSGTTIAARLVRATGKVDYMNRYFARMIFLTTRYSKEVNSIKQAPMLSAALDPNKQVQLALDETLKKARKYEASKKRLDNGPIAQKAEGVIRIEKVGRALRDRLKSKKIDFLNAPLSQIAQGAGELNHNDLGMEQKGFTRALFRYIEYYRGDKKEDLLAMKRNRRNSGKSYYNKKRYATMGRNSENKHNQSSQ